MQHHYHYCVMLQHYTQKTPTHADGLWSTDTLIGQQAYEQLKATLLVRHTTHYDHSTHITVLSLTYLGHY